MTEDDEQTDATLWNSIKIGLLGGVAVLALFALLLTPMGYFDHLERQGTEAVCVETFGNGTTYVGQASAFSSTGICELPDGEQRYVETTTAPMSVDSFIDYVTGG